MKLSEHFTLDELTTTNNSALRAKNREDAMAHVEKLQQICTVLLEPIRKKWGPIRVTSGYRGPALNAATKGASPTSQHSLAEAADIVPNVAPLEDVMAWIVKESGIPYGQVILEKRGGPSWQWIHISLGAPFRDKKKCGQAMICPDGKTYLPYKG